MLKKDGTTSSYVNLKLDRATVVYDPDLITLDQIKQTILQIGFQVGDIKKVSQ